MPNISWNSIPTFAGMFIPAVRFTADELLKLTTAVTVGNPYTGAGAPTNEKGRRQMAEHLVSEAKNLPSVDLQWELPTTGFFSSGMCGYVHLYTFWFPNSPKFQWGSRKFLPMWTWASSRGLEDPTSEGRPVFLAELYKKGIDAMRPDFAFLDNFGKFVFKPERREADLRQFAFGVTCYGPELVDQIGVQKLESCPAWKVEEFPWGGYWVQLAENPFTVTDKKRQAVQDHLGLRKLFNDPKGPRQLEPVGDIRIKS